MSGVYFKTIILLCQISNTHSRRTSSTIYFQKCACVHRNYHTLCNKTLAGITHTVLGQTLSFYSISDVFEPVLIMQIVTCIHTCACTEWNKLYTYFFSPKPSAVNYIPSQFMQTLDYPVCSLTLIFFRTGNIRCTACTVVSSPHLDTTAWFLNVFQFEGCVITSNSFWDSKIT